MFRRPQFSRQGAHHEKCEFRGGLGEYVRGVGEGNLVAVGIGAVDVVEAHGKLGHNFQFAFARLEYFGVNGIAQGSDEPVDAGFHFLDNQAFGGASGLG